MKDVKIPKPGILPKRPELSVCMIVRDEEKTLSRCLESVEGVADQLIVVDTGSRDRTISIAKSFGARVYRFEWSDDFSAARNESLKHATGDWILQLDADEKLPERSVPLAKSAMLNPFCLLCETTLDNGVRCLSKRFWKVGRLFRNHPEIRYNRPYHETIEASVHQLIRTEPRWQVVNKPEIIIEHYDYELSEGDRRKKVERALRIMEPYIEKNPNDAYILTQMGVIYTYLKRYVDAERCLWKAMQIDPNWLDTAYSFGLTLQRQGKLDVAIQFYKKVLDSAPNFVEVYNSLGVAYGEKGMLDEAISTLKKAVEINPDLEMAFNNLGAAYMQKGMLDEAISALKKALTIKPDYVEACSNLGEAYVYKGMLDEAISALKKALTIKPDYAEAYSGLGLAYAEKGVLDEAISALKKALTIKPDYVEAYNNLAAAYYERGNYREAIKHCDRAMELGGQINPELWESLKTCR